MAALKLLNNKSTFSLSQGFRNYFYCCFPSGDNTTSPTRSTEGVLKADELEKTLNDDDDSSLRSRRSLIADNFGYVSDCGRQLPETGESNSSRGMMLENQKALSCQSEVTEKSHIVDLSSRIEKNENSTEKVKKGLNSLLAIAEQATNELEAGDNQIPQEDEEHDNQPGHYADAGATTTMTRTTKGPDETETTKLSSVTPQSSSSPGSLENKNITNAHHTNADGIASSTGGGTAEENTAGIVDNLENSEPTKHEELSPRPAVIASSAGAVAIGKSSNLEVVDGHDGNLFDISDLQHNIAGSNLVSSCGSILLSLSHDSHVNRMTINIKEARDLPSRERGGVNQAQIRTLLLPLRKVRHKTKVVVSNESTSTFNETFECKVQTDELTSMGLRVRLYGRERLRKDRLIGETIINFNHSNTIGEHFWATLEPRSNLSHGDSLNSISSLTHSESDSSTHSLQHGGTLELMLGLAYNGVTGRLSVEVIKGSNFKNAATKRPPDTYVKIELKGPDGERITHSKTTIRRGHPNPLFKETFMFQVAQSQLNNVSLHVSVFVQKSLKRKEMIGWFTMGSTNSSDDDSAHWTCMLESKGEQVCKWHALLEP